MQAEGPASCTVWGRWLTSGWEARWRKGTRRERLHHTCSRRHSRAGARRPVSRGPQAGLGSPHCNLCEPAGGVGSGGSAGPQLRHRLASIWDRRAQCCAGCCQCVPQHELKEVGQESLFDARRLRGSKTCVPRCPWAMHPCCQSRPGTVANPSCVRVACMP